VICWTERHYSATKRCNCAGTLHLRCSNDVFTWQTPCTIYRYVPAIALCNVIYAPMMFLRGKLPALYNLIYNFIYRAAAWPPGGEKMRATRQLPILPAICWHTVSSLCYTLPSLSEGGVHAGFFKKLATEVGQRSYDVCCCCYDRVCHAWLKYQGASRTTLPCIPPDGFGEKPSHIYCTSDFTVYAISWYAGQRCSAEDMVFQQGSNRSSIYNSHGCCWPCWLA
jgi:hypothetical protein